MPNFGIHAGVVWRRIDQLSQQDNVNRPISAFNVPMHDPRSGPGRRARQRRRRPDDPGVQPEPGESRRCRSSTSCTTRRARTTSTRSSSAPTGAMPASGRSPVRGRTAGTATTPTATSARTCARSARRAGRRQPERPDQHRRRPLHLRHVVGESARHVSSAVEHPGDAGAAHAGGQPYGRTINASAANGINYGAQRILAEPIGTRTAGQHRAARHPRGEGDQDRRRPVASRSSSTATT